MEKHAIRETGKAGLPAAGWVSCIRVVEFNEIYVEHRGYRDALTCFELRRAARAPGVPKKEPQRKKDSAI